MRKYSKDFKIEVVKDKNGREKTKAVYYGPYFEVSLDEKELHYYKLTGFLFLLVIGVIHVGAGFAANLGMYQFYVALPYVAVFLPLFYLALGIFHIPHEKRSYRRDEVGLSFDQIRTSSVGLLITLGLGILGEIAFLVFAFAGNQTNPDFMFLALEVGAAIAAYFFFRIQRRTLISPLKDQSK